MRHQHLVRNRRVDLPVAIEFRERRRSPQLPVRIEILLNQTGDAA
jgi:hypothetical protein